MVQKSFYLQAKTKVKKIIPIAQHFLEHHTHPRIQTQSSGSVIPALNSMSLW